MSEVRLEEKLGRKVYSHDLYDLYSPLLTDKQREAWELHEFEDLSLAEVAERLGISRQGVSDLIGRSRERLEELEALLGFHAREASLEAEIGSLRRRLDDLSQRRGMQDV